MNIAVYCGSGFGKCDDFRQSAVEVGHFIGSCGHTLVYGGSNTGLMGTVADATLESGGEVIGVVPDVPLIQSRKHSGITKIIETKTMAERKSTMIELADAFIALPGGLGTLDEVTEILSFIALNIIDAPVVFVDTNDYYAGMKTVLDNIITNEFGTAEYTKRVLFSSDITEIKYFIEKN